MKDYSTPAEGILKREADGTIASQEVTEVELVDLAAVATSGSYNDLNDKPTMPTVGDATITIKQGSTTKGSFTTNQSSGKTITLDANTDTLGKNIVGTSVTASANGEVSGTDGVYLNHIEGTNTVKSSHKIVGSGATTVKSDANGNITINTDKPTFCVSIEEAQDGTLTVNKTPEEIYAAYTSGYAVYAIYKNQALELLLSLKLALPSITEFSGIYGVTESAVGFITVSNTGSGWVKQLSSVPINNKVVPTTRTVNGKALSDDIALTAADVGAQPTIIANGFLKGDGSGGIISDKPVFTVTITQTEKDGAGTADKTSAEILAAYNAGYNVQAVCTYYNSSIPVILPLLSPNGYGAGVLEFSGLLYDGSDGDYCQALSVFMLGEACQCYKTEVATGDVYQKIFEIKQPYLVTFTKKTATEYTADKTLREIFEAVKQRKYFVYGYIDVDYTDAYIPMSSFFTTGQGTTDSPTNYYIYFEGPMASSNSGNMVENNKCARFISLKATNNADATSTAYTYTTYQLLSTAATVNNKSFATRSITLNAADVNAVGLTGDQTIAGKKTFTEKATFDLGFTAGGSTFTGGCSFTGQQSFNDGIVVGGQTYYKENSYISGKIHYDEDSTVDFTNATVTGISGILPTVTTSNNGQFLKVVNGAWAAATVDNANGGTF